MAGEAKAVYDDLVLKRTHLQMQIDMHRAIVSEYLVKARMMDQLISGLQEIYTTEETPNAVEVGSVRGMPENLQDDFPREDEPVSGV